MCVWTGVVCGEGRQAGSEVEGHEQHTRSHGAPEGGCLVIAVVMVMVVVVVIVVVMVMVVVIVVVMVMVVVIVVVMVMVVVIVVVMVMVVVVMMVVVMMGGGRCTHQHVIGGDETTPFLRLRLDGLDACGVDGVGLDPRLLPAQHTEKRSWCYRPAEGCYKETVMA
jgi:hypothetical protein